MGRARQSIPIPIPTPTGTGSNRIANHGLQATPEPAPGPHGRTPAFAPRPLRRGTRDQATGRRPRKHYVMYYVIYYVMLCRSRTTDRPAAPGGSGLPFATPPSSTRPPRHTPPGGFPTWRKSSDFRWLAAAGDHPVPRPRSRPSPSRKSHEFRYVFRPRSRGGIVSRFPNRREDSAGIPPGCGSSCSSDPVVSLCATTG